MNLWVCQGAVKEERKVRQKQEGKKRIYNDFDIMMIRFTHPMCETWACLINADLLAGIEEGHPHLYRL